MKLLYTVMIAIVLLFGGMQSLWAQDKIVTIEGTRIRGDQEAPLVLYLVPWKQPEARSLERPDEQIMLERPLEPLQRAEFRRLMSYHRHFQALNSKETDLENAEIDN